MKKEISLNEFIREFEEYNRDYYSYEGYEELYNYYEETENFELDIIAICCDVSEYEEQELITDYGYLLPFEDWKEQNDLNKDYEEIDTYLEELMEELEQHTHIIKLENSSYLVWSF